MKSDHKAQDVMQHARAGYVVPGCDPVEAIAAHRIALDLAQASGAAEDRRVAEFTLRAILVARMDDSQAQLDYLAGLPETAWPAVDGATAGQVRAEYLAMFQSRINLEGAA